MPRSRKARPEDVDEICGSLPETELGISWGDRPTWKVPRGPKGKGFLLYRAPSQNAVDPTTGEMYDDLIVITTPTEVEKLALVEDEGTPFFTIPHFDGYSAVLVQQSRLGEHRVVQALPTYRPRRQLGGESGVAAAQPVPLQRRGQGEVRVGVGGPDGAEHLQRGGAGRVSQGAHRDDQPPASWEPWSPTRR